MSRLTRKLFFFCDYFNTSAKRIFKLWNTALALETFRSFACTHGEKETLDWKYRQTNKRHNKIYWAPLSRNLEGALYNFLLSDWLILWSLLYYITLCRLTIFSSLTIKSFAASTIVFCQTRLNLFMTDANHILYRLRLICLSLSSSVNVSLFVSVGQIQRVIYMYQR